MGMPTIQPANRLGVSHGGGATCLLWLLLSVAGPGHAQNGPDSPPVADEAISDDDGGPEPLTGAPHSGDTGVMLTPSAATTKPLPDSGDAESPVWGIPPLPWRGALTLSAISTMPAYAPSSTSMVEGLSLSGSSYVWQPWFLKLNGSMFLGLSQDQSGGSSGKTESQNFGFGGNLLQSSRFPFGFTGAMSKVATERSAETGDHFRTEMQTTSLGLTQGYAPLSRGYQTSWNYNLMRSEGRQSDNGRVEDSLGTTSQNFGGSVAIPLFTENPQSLNFGGGVSSTRNNQAGARSDALNFGASHGIYLEDYVMTISSTALMSSTRLMTKDENTRSSVSNVASGMEWVPSDDYPLTIGAGLGFFNSKAEAASQRSSVATVNANLVARYPLDEYWSFNGRYDANQATTSGNEAENKTIFHSLSGGVNWSGKQYQSKLKNWGYSLSYGASGGLAYTSLQGANMTSVETSVTGGANIGHSLSRAYLDFDKAPVTLALSQGYGMSFLAATGDVAQTLNHSVSASWAPSSDSSSRQFNASASDGRAIGGSAKNAFQQVSLGMAYQAMISVYSSLSASASLGYSRQEGESGGRQTMSGTVGAQYSHGRFANVSGLNYSARYNLITRENQANSDGDYSFEHLVAQAWSWRYGLLGWQVNHSLSTIGEGGVDQVLTLSVTRDFSGVL